MNNSTVIEKLKTEGIYSQNEYDAIKSKRDKNQNEMDAIQKHIDDILYSIATLENTQEQ